MDNTAKFILAVLMLLPLDYAIIKFVDLFIWKLRNHKNQKQCCCNKQTTKENPEIDTEF